MYAFTLDGVRVLHTGDIGRAFKRREIAALHGQVDVMFALSGGVHNIEVGHMKEAIDAIAPRIVVPMHYFSPKGRLKILPVDEIARRFPAGRVVRTGSPELEVAAATLPPKRISTSWTRPAEGRGEARRMEAFFRDLRQSVRGLLRRPTFTAVAVLSLALGIGANTAIFTAVKAVFLQSFPVREPERLVAVFTSLESLTALLPVSYPNFVDLHDRNRTFSALITATPLSLSLAEGNGEPERIDGEMVSAPTSTCSESARRAAAPSFPRRTRPPAGTRSWC